MRDVSSDVSRADIFVDWKSLAAAGIERHTPVTNNTRGAIFIQNLAQILNNADGGKGRIGFVIEDGVVEISAGRNLSTDLAALGYRPNDLLQDRKVTLDQLTADAHKATEEGKYREALEYVDRIHSLDPNNDYAINARSILEKKLLAAQLEIMVPEIAFDGEAIGNVIDFLRDVSGRISLSIGKRLKPRVSHAQLQSAPQVAKRQVLKGPERHSRQRRRRNDKDRLYHR